MGKPATLTVAETLPKSFLLSAQTRGGKPAMREKELGIWRVIAWNDWVERAKEVALALATRGVELVETDAIGSMLENPLLRTRNCLGD